MRDVERGVHAAQNARHCPLFELRTPPARSTRWSINPVQRALPRARDAGAKRSEADLRHELEDTGPRLMIRRAAPDRKIVDRYVVLFRSGVADPDHQARELVERAGGTVHFTYDHAVQRFASLGTQTE